MSKGDFIAVYRQIADVRQAVFNLTEKVEDLAAQVQHLRRQANSHAIALAAVKRIKPPDAAAIETAE